MKERELDFKFIQERLDKYIKGQDRQKKQLTSIIIRHYKQKGGFDYRKGERHIVPLVIGPSGSGKTATIEALAQILDVDFCPIFCSQISAEGYKGSNLTEVIGNFYASIGYNRKRLERCVVFIDEFDKILCKNYHDFYNKTDQSSYLKLLDGGEISIPARDRRETISTSNMLVILAGAFLDLDKILKRKQNKTGLIKESDISNKTMSEVIALQELGLMDEIIGRISTIITFEQNDKNTIKEIISGEHSMFTLWQNYFLENYGVKLSISNEALDYVCGHVSESPLGVRALNQCLNPVLLDSMIDVETDFKISNIEIVINANNKFSYKIQNGKRAYIPLCSNKEDHIDLFDIHRSVDGYRETIDCFTKELTDELGCIYSQLDYKELKKMKSLYKSILLYLSSEVNKSDLNTGSLIKLLNCSFEPTPGKSTFEVMLEEEPLEPKKIALLEYREFKRSDLYHDNKVRNIAIQAVKNFEINHEIERSIENE